VNHSGFLQFEDEGIAPRTEGSVDFTGQAVLLRVGDNIVAEVPPSGLSAAALGDGRYRIEIGGEGLLFEPSDPKALDRELTAHAFANRLTKTQVPAPLPATMAQAVPAVSAPTPALAINPPKSPGVAAVLSFLWPGLGQIYNGEGLKAVLFILAQIVNLLLTAILVGFLTGFVVWIWAMVDAYKGAETYNLKQRVQFPGG